MAVVDAAQHAAGHRQRRRDPADRRRPGHRLGRQLRRGGGPGAGGPFDARRRARSCARRWKSPPASTSTRTRNIVVEELACAELTPAARSSPSSTGTSSGQDDAKRAVAIAIRNRWRRQQLPEEMRQEVAPKNILMIGPTGVGKTEIARRLAKLTGAPFIKVEATKYTEVGYYGRDVESMVRELVENAIGLVREQEREERRGRGPAARRGAAARPAGPAAAGVRRRARQPRFGRALRADAREDAGHAGRRRTGAAAGRADDRAEGRADDAHRHGHGADGHRPAGHVREDPAQEHRPARDDRRRGPRRALRAGVRRADQPGEGQRGGRSNWPRTWASSSSTRSTRSWPASRRTGPTSRGRACSAICCRSSKARRCRPATATSGPTTSCSSPPGRSTAPSRAT